MERHVMKSEAQSHIDAYLEYRMIVGNRDNGVMLPEAEYEQLRKQFYENREKHGTHFVNTGFLRNPTRPRRALDNGTKKALPSGDIGSSKMQLSGGKGSRVLDDSVTPFELINRPFDVSKPSSAPRKRVTNSTKTLPSSQSSKRTSSVPFESLTTEEQIEQVQQQLQDIKLSEAKQYALKKQLKVLQAKKVREDRKHAEETNYY